MISNCVLNLVPDKARAFAEIFRVLKPGGRLAESDIALKQPLPDELVKDFYAYIGCVAGAIPIDKYQTDLRAAVFDAIDIIDSGMDLNVRINIRRRKPASGCKTTKTTQILAGNLPEQHRVRRLVQPFQEIPGLRLLCRFMGIDRVYQDVRVNRVHAVRLW